MDAIGNIPQILLALPAPVKAARSSTDSISLPGASTPGLGDTSTVATDFNVQSAEAKRYNVVQKAAQNIANIYVVSDERFTIFKDATGQYITRFTSLRDGKVTYIPEPDILKMGNSGNTLSPALLTIKA